MNSDPNPSADQLVWPPLEEDLDAIEVLEIPWPEPAPAPASPSEPVATVEAMVAATAPDGVPSPAPPTPAPPAPPRQGVIEVVELDAVAGTESYVLDIRDQLTPGIGRAQSGTTEAAGRELQWPPSDADLDAVDVLELSPPQAVVVAEVEALAVPGRRDVLPEPTESPLDAGVHAAPAPKTRTLVVGLGLAAAVTAGGWWAVGDRGGPVTPEASVSPEAPVARMPDPESSPEPAVPVVVSDQDDLEALVTEARRALEAGERVRAVDLAGAYLAAGGRAAAAYTLVENVLSSARADVERARRDATVRMGAGAADLAEPTRRESTAIDAWRAGRYGPAVRGMIEARREFARLQAPSAGVEAVAAAPSPAEAPEPRLAPAAPVLETLSPAAPVARPPMTPPAGRPATEGPAAASSPPPLPVNVAPAPPRSAATDATPAPPATVAAPATTPSATDAGIRRALRAYQSAYESLDARAAAAVYPSVDERALARAFDGLNSQKLEFDRCEVTPLADGRARASCVGRMAFVPRVGNQAPRVEARRWNFVLARDGEAWRIAQAQVSAR